MYRRRHPRVARSQRQASGLRLDQARHSRGSLLDPEPTDRDSRRQQNDRGYRAAAENQRVREDRTDHDNREHDGAETRKRRDEQHRRPAKLESGGDITEPLSEPEAPNICTMIGTPASLGSAEITNTAATAIWRNHRATFFFITRSFSLIDDTYMHYLAKN